jgi:S-adenosylmethionine:tRNA ribosyltransferase-isomerase
MSLTLADFDYHLPKELIAQAPAEPRDHCQLMVVNRDRQQVSHHRFYELSHLLSPYDVLVLNQTKVFPARLRGQKRTGGAVECLLVSQLAGNAYTALVKPGLKPETDVLFSKGVLAKVSRVHPEGEVDLTFSLAGKELMEFIHEHGHTPLPPYIQSMLEESQLREAYQTVYATVPGSAAAPTAGMHFTPALLDCIKARGIAVETITLHVGLGTFQRLRHETVADNRLHKEPFLIDGETRTRLAQAKSVGKRIVAVGTTSARALESMDLAEDTWQKTDIFIYPPYRFKMVDALITNFHLPESSLLMMIAAFTTTPQTQQVFMDFKRSFIGKAYQEAIESDYRFFSFGDAMLIE